MSATNAGGTPKLRIEFFDYDAMPYPPTSFSYTVTDVGSATVVRASQALLPASTIDIQLTAADTVAIGNSLTQTRHVVWVASSGTPQQETGDFFFDVRPLS